MRHSLTALASVLILMSGAQSSFARDGGEAAPQGGASVSAGALLYLDQAHWRQADGAQKIALATDFMRIFCGDPAMPPSLLVDCLDATGDSGSILERALSCVATRPLPKTYP